jgi:hypothetical protein
MSLHRILNNDGQGSPSVRGVSIPQATSPQPVIDPALSEISQANSNSSSREAPAPRRSTRHQQPPPPSVTPQPHIHYMSPGFQHPAGYPTTASGGWDLYTGEWHPFPPSSGVPNAHHSYFMNGNGNGHLPPGSVGGAPDGEDSDGLPETNGRGRKRKAADDDDADYHPRSSRRVSLNISV